jgi:TolB-like protein
MADTPAVAPPAPVADGRSLVVLPFVNQSPDPDNEFFSDGLTEEVISDLAAIKSLRVISRTSSMQLKGTTKGVPAIGRELGVRHVLEGSVRKAGNALRITAQLIDASTDSRVWGDKYGGTIDDVFELQERVAREIVAALGITLTSDEDRHLAERPIEDPRAFELFLRARQELRRYDLPSIERAEELIRQAIDLEGEAPPLKALLAWGKVTRVKAGVAADRRGLDEAMVVAEELLRSVPEAPFGHALMGFIGYERGLMPEAIGHLRAALEREPDDADAIFYLGIGVLGCGDIGAGERAAARMMAVDPLAPLTWLLAGVVHWWKGNAEVGLPKLERALTIDPGNAMIRWTVGYTRALVGDAAGAARDAAVLVRDVPNMPYTPQLLAIVQAMEGRQEEARATLQGVQFLDAHQKFHLAESFAVSGDTERGLDLLEEAVDNGFHPGDFIASYCPFFSSLRGIPRFEAIAEKALRYTREFVASGVAP